MTLLSPGDLAAALEQTIRATPAVTALYPPAPWWSTAARQAATALGLAENPPVVTVTWLPDGSLDVCAAIATGHGAATTCRAVHDAVVDHLHRLGHGDATVRITVVQATG